MNTSDEKAVKKRQKEDERLLNEEKEDMRAVLQMPSGEGMRVMYRLLERCHVFHSTFSPDVSVMSFNEGERNVGLFLQGVIMQSDPASYFKMLQDKQEKENGRDDA